MTSDSRSECHNAKTEWVPYRYGGHILVCTACLSACYTKPARKTASEKHRCLKCGRTSDIVPLDIECPFCDAEKTAQEKGFDDAVSSSIENMRRANTTTKLYPSKPLSPMGWEEAVEIWSKQGRTEEQIWAVKNFLTGAGEKVVHEAYSRGNDEAVDRMTDAYKRSVEAARAERTREIVEMVKELGDDITKSKNEAFSNLIARLTSPEA